MERLDSIDGTLEKLTKQLAEHSHPPTSSDSTISHRHSNEQQSSLLFSSSARLNNPRPGNAWQSLVLPSLQREQLNQSPLEPIEELRPSVLDKFATDRVQLEHGERAYKYPASMTFLKSISKQLASSCKVDADIIVNKADCRATASVQAMMLHQLECFPFQGKCLQPNLPDNYQPIVAPPQMITRLFVDGYLRDINTRIPIFDEKRLRDAVDIYYSHALHAPSAPPTEEHTIESPWAIIFNNIALLELGLETQVVRWQGSSSDTSSISACSLTDNLSSFLRNCNHALADLAPYTRPTVLYVKALLTLVS